MSRPKEKSCNTQNPPRKDPAASSAKPSAPKPLVDPSLLINKPTSPPIEDPKQPVVVSSGSDSGSRTDDEGENDEEDEQNALQISKAHVGRTPGSYDINIGEVVAARVAAKDLEALEQDDRDRM